MARERAGRVWERGLRESTHTRRHSRESGSPWCSGLDGWFRGGGTEDWILARAGMTGRAWAFVVRWGSELHPEPGTEGMFAAAF